MTQRLCVDGTIMSEHCPGDMGKTQTQGTNEPRTWTCLAENHPAWKAVAHDFQSYQGLIHVTRLSAAESTINYLFQGSHRPGCPWARTLSEPAQRTHPGSATVLLISGLYHGNWQSRFLIERWVCLKIGYIPLNLIKIDGESPVCLLKWLFGALIPQTYPNMIKMAGVLWMYSARFRCHVGGRRYQKDVIKQDCARAYDWTTLHLQFLSSLLWWYLVCPIYSMTLAHSYTFPRLNIYIYIYTANASALPGIATTAGNASAPASASASSSSSSSSSNPYWRSSMNVEV